MIWAVEEPELLEPILTAALGVLGRVHKKRTLYCIGQTRIHLDQVEGLGHFIELEVVLSEGQSPREGREKATNLMEQLEISQSDLVAGAYLDLLGSRPD